MNQLTTFKPSAYQSAIFDWVVNGRGDAVVQAAAGSGKTTTLVEAAKLLKSDRAVFLAFNKHISQQLQTRLGSAMTAKTIHSVGLATLRGAIRKPLVDDNKYGDIGKIYAQEIADDLKRNYASELRRWARNKDGKEPEEPLSAGQVLGQLKQLAHYTRVTLTHEKDFEAVQEMVDHFGCLDSGLDLKMVHYPLVSILREGQQIAERQGIIDYDDMLWLPYRWNLEPSKCDWVAIDECVTGDTLVTLANGNQMPIQSIVEQRLPVSVLCYNEQTSKIEAKPVTGWRKVPRRGRQILQIGNLKGTFDHPVYTRQLGYVSMQGALTHGNVEVLVLDNEKLRSECFANGQGAVNCYRWATWRRIDQQGTLEGETGQCQSEVYSRTSTVTLPKMEAIGTSSLGRNSNIDHTANNRVWWNRLSFHNSNPSSIYRGLPTNKTRWQEETDHASIATIPESYCDSCLVHGRWQHRTNKRTNSCILFSERGSRNNSSFLYREWNTLQEDGHKERINFNFQCTRNEISDRVSDSTYSSINELQSGDYARRGVCSLWENLSIQERLQTQQAAIRKCPETNLQQQLQCEIGTYQQEEWVYCLDVADNHNFFANDILVHNCQDVSPAQLDLILKMRSRGGRMIWVGDKSQAIFGFAGALNDSIDRIIKATNATVLPLSICYRCPTSHIKLAQGIVPSIEAAPNAIEGIIEYISYEKVHSIIAEGDLVISRCTAPVVKLCIELIAKKIPARVRGRDIGKALTAIVKEVAKQPCFDFEKFGYALQAYQHEKIIKLQQKKNSESQIESLRDRVSGIWVCYQAFNSYSLLDFCAEIEELFSDSRSSVVLSTVHRAKGLEEKRVFILRPDQLPLRWQNQQQWQLGQEYNLTYVSRTRAKEALFFVTDEKPIEVKPEDEDGDDAEDDYEDEDEDGKDCKQLTAKSEYRL